MIRLITRDPKLSCKKYLEGILKNNNNININDADPETGDTALHQLVAFWNFDLKFNEHFSQNEVTTDEYCMLITMLIRYDMNCLLVKNKHGWTPKDINQDAINMKLDIIKPKFNELEVNEKNRQTKVMNKAMLFYAAYKKDENKNSPINSLPLDLVNKIGAVILKNDFEDVKIPQVGKKS